MAGHKLRLRNITSSTTDLVGANAVCDAGTAMSDSTIISNLTVSTDSIFELWHYTGLARATNGLGAAISSGDIEIYAEARIEKIG